MAPERTIAVPRGCSFPGVRGVRDGGAESKQERAAERGPSFPARAAGFQEPGQLQAQLALPRRPAGQ
uniref:Uncharacterized protein n=1 Tax=Sphaerodactylus townsendi TaxID=933632 RepID=A0ACB8F6U2_9SAUR